MLITRGSKTPIMGRDGTILGWKVDMKKAGLLFQPERKETGSGRREKHKLQLRALLQ